MERTLKSNAEQIVGFIDIGTNSIRLLLVRDLPHHSYRVITQQKETVRLGEGEFSRQQQLQPEAMDRAVLVCRKFTELARSYGADPLYAVATSATREAANQAEFLERLRSEAGLEVQVISGREEARLIYLGITSGINIGKQKAFFIDIGGGSTEVIVGDQEQYDYLDSLKLGAIRLTANFLANHNGPVPPALYHQMQRHVRNSAIRSLQRLGQYPAARAFGSSGTIENLAEICCRYFYKRRLQKDDVVTHEQLQQVIQMLCALSLEERCKVDGINPERADIIIGGAAILDTLMQELSLPQLAVSERSLRDGLLLDYLARRNDNVSLREQSVLQLGRACAFDEFHANRVTDLTLELYDSAAQIGLHGLGPAERELLEYAALLHDCGAFLSYNNHQAHSYYLISNADLLGFNQAEIGVIAAIAYFHRKTLPRKKHPQFSDLAKTDQKRVVVLSTLLRIAETLDRSHSNLVARAYFQQSQPSVVTLALETNGDCQLELWGLKNHHKAFEEAFGRKLIVVAAVDGCSG